MGIFDTIKSAIFGSAKATEASPSTGKTPDATPAAAAGTASAAPAAAAPAGAGAAAPMSQVDVEAVLAGLAAKNKQKLDWRKSIVDLMKLLDLDSSLAARKELAKELNYSGDTNDSAAMNVWLHKQVMIKLAASGGKVPEDLRT
jgi:3-oxoacyl-ACP reductase-like protein